MRRARVLVSIALAGCASQPRANRANATTVTAPAQRAWVATGYRELRWDPGWNRPLRESDPARLDSWGPFVAALAASSSQVRAQTEPRVVERNSAEGDRRPSAFEQRFQRLFALGLPDPRGMRFVRGVAASPYARRRRAWYGWIEAHRARTREPQLALSLEGEWELVRGPLEPLDLARFERESFESLRCSVTDRTSASCPWLAVLMIARALGDPTSRAWRAALAIDPTAAEPALADALIARPHNQIARHFQDGNDLEAVRSTRALLAHFERHSPADARSSNRVLVSPAQREALRLAMEALRRATSREASSQPTSRVAQLVADLADCPAPERTEPIECPAMDELARIGENAIEPLIVALERDRRPTRFTRVVGREFAPVAMLADTLLAQWFVDLGEHEISVAPSAPDEQRWAASAAAYRAYRGSLRGRTPIRALIDRWTDPTRSCSSVGPLRSAWMNCGHRCTTPFERATVDERRRIVEGIVPVVSRCGGESYCVLSRWLEAAPPGADREALIERIFAADRRTPQLFEHLVRDRERRSERDRRSFALRHFAAFDGEPTLEAWASRIDAVASLGDDPALNSLVLETLRARGVLRAPTRRALLVRLTTARTTAVAREMLAPLLADRTVIGTLQIQREKSLLTEGGASRWAGRTPSAPEGTFPWRACDSIAMELCSNEGALLDSVSARDAHIARCARVGPRAVMGGAPHTACTNSVTVHARAMSGE